MKATGKLNLVLTLLLGLAAFSLGGKYSTQPKLSSVHPYPPTVSSPLHDHWYTEDGDIRHRFAGRDTTLELLAIRVHFESDTLATTTGDGSFFYEMPDTVDEADWIIDPPPHDKSYFGDQLHAMSRFFNRFSRGKLTITGKVNNSHESGGDVYPLGEEASYGLPYPMWHINYGVFPDRNGDDQNLDRLNEKLVQLFVDSWLAADQDPDFDASNYDLFVVFHAGAGNEFDTGFDLTPHDIPSVYVGLEDLERYYPEYADGIPVNDGTVLITEGVILPEMQRQGDVEVGMLGSVCTQVGYLIGMPHLYQPETGDPGIGMFGLMDRGFGGYFGMVPIPPSAWMRAFMGWDEVTTVTSGTIHLGALHLPDSLFSDSLHRLVKVPINDHEYFLLEARQRDPEEDSLTYAWDREGKRLQLNDDYSWERLDGSFGIIDSVEDHDFDFPASGILIWHINENVIQTNIYRDAIQENRYNRGVDVEEADGSEDIGEEYAFLTAGDGSEYGVIEDAWYLKNDVFKEANGLQAVEFSAYTTPSTDASAGGATHLRFSQFSEINDTMTVTISNMWQQGNFPEKAHVDTVFATGFILADVDGDTAQEVVFHHREGHVWALDGNGAAMTNDTLFTTLSYGILNSAAADVDGDGLDELFFLTHTHLARIDYDPATKGVDIRQYEHGSAKNHHLTIIGPETDPYVVFTMEVDDQNNSEVVHTVAAIDASLDPVSLFQSPLSGSVQSIAQLGDENSSQIAVLYSGNAFTIMDVVTGETSEYNLDTSASGTGLWFTEVYGGDFSTRSGYNLIFDSWRHVVHWNESNPDDVLTELPYEGFDVKAIADLDHNGTSEPVGFDLSNAADIYPDIEGAGPPNNLFAGLTPENIWVEDSYVKLSNLQGRPDGNAIIYNDRGNTDSRLLMSSYYGKVAGFDLDDGSPITGFPLEFGGGSSELAIGQLDSDVELELVMFSGSSGLLKVVSLPTSGTSSYRPPTVVWGMRDGNARRSRSHGNVAAEDAVINPYASDPPAYCWPNPVIENRANFRYTATRPGWMNLRIYDLVGREVISGRDYKDHSGEAEFALNCSDLASGVYIAILEHSGKKEKIRFAVVK